VRKATPAAGLARSRTATRLGRKARRNVSAYGFLIGAVLCFAFFSWHPMCREIVMSFQKT
jgi:multiple sugar transport system permease protein